MCNCEDALITEQCTQVSILSLRRRLLLQDLKNCRQILVLKLRKNQSGDISNEFEQKWGICLIFYITEEKKSSLPYCQPLGTDSVRRGTCFSIPSLLLIGSGSRLSSFYKFYIGCIKEKLLLRNVLF